MNEQESLPKQKRVYKKKEIRTPILIAREKLQEATIANNKAMWEELLSDKFDIIECLAYFRIATNIQNLRDYIALNKCPM